MSLSALKLGEALASRLNGTLPSPIHVSVERPPSAEASRDADVLVRVFNGDTPWAGQGFSDSDLRARQENLLGDAACNMAVAMLNGVQDSVIQILGQRWPILFDELALPDGRADAARVYLWFGESEDRAAVTLRPIDLREISADRS